MDKKPVKFVEPLRPQRFRNALSATIPTKEQRGLITVGSLRGQCWQGASRLMRGPRWNVTEEKLVSNFLCSLEVPDSAGELLQWVS